MSSESNSYDEIVVESEQSDRGQALKYLPRWPAVNIDFEDVIYTVENGTESEYRTFKILNYF
jgi:hypothetical protein